MSVETVRKKAVSWMIDLARDDSHGYDQDDRWGEHGDYDCSSAVITAYQKAGVPVKASGATYTGNMRAVFLRCGFKDVTVKVNLENGRGLEAGDVLLNEIHHTAMYIGDGLEAEASINEFGGAHGGEPGDQTGREVLIKSYRNFPWDCVLRYMGNGSEEKPSDEPQKAPEGPYTVSLDEISMGSEGWPVRLAQTLLKGLGYTGYSDSILDLDGEFGRNTEYAVRQFQFVKCIDVDGVVGPQTWKNLIGV